MWRIELFDYCLSSLNARSLFFYLQVILIFVVVKLWGDWLSIRFITECYRLVLAERHDTV